MPPLRRKFRTKLDQKQNSLPYYPGELGDGFGNVATGTPGLVYVRIMGATDIAVNETVPNVHGLKVWVGYLPHQPRTLRILSQRKVFDSDDEFEYGLNSHANTHEYFGPGASGGKDVVKVKLQQFMPLRVMPYDGLTVAIFPGIVWTGTVFVLVSDTNDYGFPVPKTIDFSDSLTYPIPATGKAKFMLISIDDTGSVVVTQGAEVDLANLTLTEIPTVPSNTRVVLAAIRRYNSQTVIVENRMETDVVDLRFPYAHFHAPEEISGASIRIAKVASLSALGVKLTALGGNVVLVMDVAVVTANGMLSIAQNVLPIDTASSVANGVILDVI